MAIAADHDRGLLGHPDIALAQGHAVALGQGHQLLDRPVHQPGIGRWATALGCTVLSTTTRSRSLVSKAPVLWATDRLSCSSAARCSSPNRWRQRVIEERSKGSSWRKNCSPQKYW